MANKGSRDDVATPERPQSLNALITVDERIGSIAAKMGGEAF